jgi:uncharacterized protein YjhX (UPF0386 family)
VNTPSAATRRERFGVFDIGFRSRDFSMNISRTEQRVLHVLALGGRIHHRRDGTRIVAVDCIDRDGNRLVDCDLATFARLKRRGFVRSRGGAPYELTEMGRRSVRAEFDQR